MPVEVFANDVPILSTVIIFVVVGMVDNVSMDSHWEFLVSHDDVPGFDVQA